MHQSMFRHPAVRAHLDTLRSWGIRIVGPRIEEEKAKIAGIEEIVLSCERALMGRPLAGKRVLVTSGPCREPVDDVRVITTRSTGAMGKALALQAYRLGAEVTVVHNGRIPCVRNITVSSASEMRSAVLGICREQGADYYISAAAVSDFAPVRQKGKIPSGRPVTIVLEPLEKIIDEVVAMCHPVTVAFKMGWDEEKRAEAMLSSGIRMVVVNTPEAMGAAAGEFVIMTAGGKQRVKGSKEEVSTSVWDALV
ncbi:MAG: bifunctional phosphopantothenoylcysteine decarboxylase/phosphopantothenate--cysteine ligase CoaBC, partial [Methanoregulaceae archaeon]|nr:bifunctional phosphopantothenoylcysteine decarboxylase/phosphopantothenate--cysteine ligase CoaBC [Methanoregulaceae archaeon]